MDIKRTRTESDPCAEPRTSAAAAAARFTAALCFGCTAAHAGTDVLVNNPALDTTANNTQSNVVMTLAGSTAAGPNLVAAFTDSGSNVGTPNQFTGVARSTDGGATWTDLGKLPANVLGDGSYPSITRHDATGDVLLTTLPFSSLNAVQLFRSTDGGLTFNAPINAAPGIAAADRPAITVDNFAGAGNGNVYVTARDFGGTQGVKLWRSTDGGATFTPNGGTLLATPGGNNVHGQVVTVGPDHSTYVAWFDEATAPESIKVRRSTDGGLTFGSTVTVGTLGTGAGFNGDLALTGVRAGTATPASFRSNAFPQLLANPVSSGHLYVVYADNPVGTDKADVILRQSTNNGANWGPPIRVNDDATLNDQWQPTLAVTPDGSHVGVFWYDRRLDGGNNLIDYFGDVFSVDAVTGALSSGGDVRISDVSFLPEFGRDSALNPAFMGDYDFGAQADNDNFYVTWADHRDPFGTRQDVNLRFDTVPVPEPGASAVLAALAAVAAAGLRFRPRRR